MPRVFKMRDVWYMFVRPFDHSLGTWQHYRSHTGENWELVDGNVFDPEPPVGADAADMKPVFALQGEMLPDPLVLACGVGEQGNLCQWLYRLECSTG